MGVVHSVEGQNRRPLQQEKEHREGNRSRQAKGEKRNARACPSKDLNGHLPLMRLARPHKGRQGKDADKTANPKEGAEDAEAIGPLERLSAMMQPVFSMAASILVAGGRVVYLLPIFASQAELGLWSWDSNSRSFAEFPPEVLALLPSHPNFDLVSVTETPCRSGNMARLLIVNQLRSGPNHAY